MLLTDTDSLLYKTETENVYEDFCKKTKSYLTSATIEKIQILKKIQITYSDVKWKMKHATCL